MISVILVNWNGWADTIACLQSLLNSHPAPARLIVVDNSSTDESVDILWRWASHGLELIAQGDEVEHHALRGKSCPRLLSIFEYDEVQQRVSALREQVMVTEQGAIPIYVVRCSRNGGFGYGCNVGMKLGRQLGTDVFWLLNNDCVVAPETLNMVCERALQAPRTIFGTVLRYYHNPDRVQAIGGGTFSNLTGSVQTLHSPASDRRLDFIVGASMVFTASCLDQVGGFDEKIFMYFEENDFCMRAASLGYRFDVISTTVFHKHGGSQGNRPSLNAWSQVLLNKHYVLRKNLGWGPWVLFFFGMLILRATLPAGGRVERQAARKVFRTIITRALNR